MRNLVMVLQYAWQYKRWSFLNIFFNILSVICNLFSLLLFIPFLNLLFDQTPPVMEHPGWHFSKQGLQDVVNFYMSQAIMDYGKETTLVVICILVGAFFFLKNLFRYLGMYFVAIIRNNVVRDFRNKLYYKLFELPVSYFSEARKGDLITRFTSDVQEIEWSIMTSLEMIFREPIAILSALGILFFISPSLTMFALVLLPVSALVIGRIGRSLKKTSGETQQKLGELISIVEETLGGMKIIKSFMADHFFKKKFRLDNERLNRLMRKMLRKRDLASPVSEFLGAVIMLCLVYYGGRLVLKENADLTGSEFIGFVIIFSQLLNPLKSFSIVYNNAQKGAASIDRINQILNESNPVCDNPDAIEIVEFKNKIEYRDVSFAYNVEPVVKNINIIIEKGKTIALVGQSGSGKSTLVDLLLRFYDVTSGAILIDDVDIRHIRQESLRKLFGVVSQDPVLFNDTVYNNICMGHDKVPLEEVIYAAKIAYAHDFIMELENGYDTYIGERGSKLSGGQRQRIAIARAILKNPQILLMDEATSALDNESEKIVQEALDNLMKGRTSIIIAHRLSTIKNADHIYVLKEGRVVEQGTHDQLVSAQGEYYKLYKLMM